MPRPRCWSSWTDAEPQIELGLVGEHLDAGAAQGAARSSTTLIAPRVVERIGGRLLLHRRPRWHGEHELTLGGELGAGRGDGVALTDVAIIGGDRWAPRPSLLVEAGARWDRRAFGDTAVELLSPRLALVWVSRHRRHLLFATAERTGRLDEQAVGAWRDGATYTDSVGAGYQRTWHAIRLWTGLRAALPRPALDAPPASLRGGVEGGARWDGQGWRVEALGSSLAGAATLTATWSRQRGHDGLDVAAIARATADDVGWGTSATLRHRPDEDDPYDDGHGMAVGVEAFDLDDPAARSAHLTLSADW